MREYKNEESKFRFVTLAALRAKQLLRGAKPKVKMRSRNLIRLAQEEIERGLIDYRVLEQEKEDQEPKGEAVEAAEPSSSVNETEAEGSPEEREDESKEK